MSITKNIIEINNSESSNEESGKKSFFLQTNDWLKSIFYSMDFSYFMDFSYLMDWIKLGLFILLWIIFSSLSIKESLKCENKIMFIVLSLFPIVNVIMYLTIHKICNAAPINRNAVGDYVYSNNVNSKNVYPSILYKKMNNFGNNISKKPKNSNNVSNKTNKEYNVSNNVGNNNSKKPKNSNNVSSNFGNNNSKKPKNSNNVSSNFGNTVSSNFGNTVSNNRGF